jgi:hypothetical protein
MRTDRFRRLLALAFCLACIPTVALAAALAAAPAQEAAPGRIDWNRLAAIGEAPLGIGARQAALAARKNLLAALSHVRVSAELTAAQTLAHDRDAAERLRVLSLAAAAPAIDSDSGQLLQATLPLVGQVLDLLLPRAATFNTGLEPRLEPVAEAPAQPSVSLSKVEKDLVALRPRPSVGAKPLESFAQAQPPAELAVTPPVADAEHSGLVVDARGLDVVPALLPVVFDETGVGVYGAFSAPRNSVVRQGLVMYARNLDDAAARIRVGQNPLVVKAAALARETGPDLRLDGPEAAAVRALMRAKAVPERCAVVILTDN